MDDVLPLLVSTLLSGAPNVSSGDTHASAVWILTTCRADSAEAIATTVTDHVTAFHARNDSIRSRRFAS